MQFFGFAELMLLGFISLLLTATSSVISNICVPSKFYDTSFTPCTQSEIDEQNEDNSSSEKRKLYMVSVFPHLYRRMLSVNKNTCKEARYGVFLISNRFFFHPIVHWILKSPHFAGSWAICILWRSRTIASLYLYNGSNSYIL